MKKTSWLLPAVAAVGGLICLPLRRADLTWDFDGATGLLADQPRYAIPLCIAVVIFLAALQAIPVSLYEYASLEGASFIRQAFSITLPMIVPSAFLVFILSWVNAFRIFKEVYFIGGAYPEEPLYTLQNYMNNMYGKLNYQNVTTAAYSFAVIVFALFGLLFFLQNRAQRGLN